MIKLRSLSFQGTDYRKIPLDEESSAEVDKTTNNDVLSKRRALSVAAILFLVLGFCSTRQYNEEAPVLVVAPDAAPVPVTSSEESATPKLTTKPTPTPTPTPESKITVNNNNLMDFRNNITSPSLVYILTPPRGLGSVLMNTFMAGMYYKETFNRSLIVVETYSDTLYKPHRPGKEDEGLLTGWFTPKFPVVSTKDDFDEYIVPYATNPLGDGLVNGKYVEAAKKRRVKGCEGCVGPFICNGWGKDPWQENMVNFHCVYDKRKPIERYAKPMSQALLYHKLSEFACPHLKWNKQTLHDVEEFRLIAGLPVFDKSAGPTVAFHVRRTDKLIKEARLYEGNEYVNELKTAVPQYQDIRHCFVATDDARAVAEVSDALRTSDIHCEVHSLAQTNAVSRTQTVQFITELTYMMNATYFVGSFSSNVASLAGLLRSCDETIPKTNFSNSFDAEGKQWHFV